MKDLINMPSASQAPLAAIPAWRLHHVALSVPDLDSAIEWYATYLGFSVIYRTYVPGLDYQVAFVERAGLRVELLQVPGVTAAPPERGEPMADLLTGGWKHLCLQVDDLAGTLTGLRAKGVAVALEPFEHDGIRAAFIRDNTGSLIELVEIVDPGMGHPLDDRFASDVQPAAQNNASALEAAR